MAQDENEYTSEFVGLVLLPAGASLSVSALLLLNFLALNPQLQAFIYHQISAFFALCDVLQTVAVLLEAPLLLGSRMCYFREHLFLCASFLKVVAVMFNTGLIYYVLRNSKVPQWRLVQVTLVGGAVVSALNMFFIVYYNAASMLCFDPAPMSFSPDHISSSEKRAFGFAYLAPICVSFIVIIVMLVKTYIRLNTVFNASLRHLVNRLVPYPLIFCLALLPSSLFQIVYIVTGGTRIQFLKQLALVGIHISGALFGLFYLYVHIVEVKKSRESRSRQGTATNSSSRSRDISWTASSHSNTSGVRQSETFASEQEMMSSYHRDSAAFVSFSHKMSLSESNAFPVAAASVGGDTMAVTDPTSAVLNKLQDHR
jgi:hypothetical protein